LTQSHIHLLGYNSDTQTRLETVGLPRYISKSFPVRVGLSLTGESPLFFTQLVSKFGVIRSPDDKLSLFLDSLSMSQPLSRFLLSVFVILLGVHSVSAVKAQSALMMKFMNTGMTHNGMSSAEFNSALVALQEQA